MTNLLPCPFCGGKPILEAESCHGETGYHVLCVCRDCKLTPATYLCETKEQAIEAWNTRSDKALNRAAGKWAKADAELRALKEEQPIVRCKDCQYMAYSSHFCSYFDIYTADDKFCAWGKTTEWSDRCE